MPELSLANVLAARYASAPMVKIWSRETKVVLERDLWITVMELQRDLGVAIPEEAVQAYRQCRDQVDLAAIDARDRQLRHDVKARIEEFCSLAGYEHIHRAMTSRDLTENVEQLQIRQSLLLIRDRVAAVLHQLGVLATEYSGLAIVGRSHNVAAQVTTLGKRFASAAQELLLAYGRLEHLISTYPLRGIKGPVGTQQDLLELLDGDSAAVARFEQEFAERLGFETTLTSVGQVYPRSLDFDVISTLVQLAASPGSLATSLRLMAGENLVTEGFIDGQVGSSAMPHKMNARSCERVNGLVAILGGHLAMVTALSGSQWNEGDVSCSVVRRVAIPDAFLALDGLFETFLTILGGFGAFPAVAARELDTYLPFVATTRMLTAAVHAGAGREQAHELIKEHAVAAALELRGDRPDSVGGSERSSDLVSRLGTDPRFPLDTDTLRALLDEPIALAGLAEQQTATLVTGPIARIVEAREGAADYRPSDIF